MNINPNKYRKIIFFTGAGMSAESGIPTFRGEGGIWEEYRWEHYACQAAFNKNPQKVLKFHEMRRAEALKSHPHIGHKIISGIENKFSNTVIITQNIDGMHQAAKSKNIIELHGSLWRVRCETENLIYNDNKSSKYSKEKCTCGGRLRPDIVWFQDMLKEDIISMANSAVSFCDLFISIGTSALVWPAAGYIQMAKENGAFCIEINPEKTEMSYLYNERIRLPASEGLVKLFNNNGV